MIQLHLQIDLGILADTEFLRRVSLGGNTNGPIRPFDSEVFAKEK
jgi:hypothetical protein